MRRFVLNLIIILFLLSGASAQVLKPYTLGAISDKNIKETSVIVRQNLEANGFNVIGEYAPAGDWNRWLMVITSEEILEAAGSTDNMGGFAATLRVALTLEDDKVLITYTTPGYWWNAYFRKEFEAVESQLQPVRDKLTMAVHSSGAIKGTEFGSKKGIDAGDLRSYRYMVGMPRFDNTVVLNSFSSYEQAIERIEANLSKGVSNVKKIYSVKLPGKDQKLYGIALDGEKGEPRFLPIIDVSNPMHTAFLPYEFLVSGKEVYMLHGRYRIALSFPDLTMRTFTRIMSTPGDIEEMLKLVTE